MVMLYVTLDLVSSGIVVFKSKLCCKLYHILSHHVTFIMSYLQLYLSDQYSVRARLKCVFGSKSSCKAITRLGGWSDNDRNGRNDLKHRTMVAIVPAKGNHIFLWNIFNWNMYDINTDIYKCLQTL